MLKGRSICRRNKKIHVLDIERKIERERERVREGEREREREREREGGRERERVRTTSAEQKDHTKTTLPYHPY